MGNCTEPRWFSPTPHPHLPAEGNSSWRGKHASQGLFQTHCTRARNGGHCVWLEGCPLLPEETVVTHITCPGPLGVLELCRPAAANLLSFANFSKSGPITISPVSASGGLVDSILFSPKKATSRFLDVFCFKSNNFLWQSPHDKFLRNVPKRACL